MTAFGLEGVLAQTLTENNISSSEGVSHLLAGADDRSVRIAPLAAWSTLPPPDVAVYGQLGGVQ